MKVENIELENETARKELASLINALKNKDKSLDKNGETLV